METVTIIGAGLAGLSAAIELAKQNIECNLISSQPSERAQSVLAEGGINGALDLMGQQDTPAEHFADTMSGGVFLADPGAVKGLTEQAPEILRWLRSIGVPFQMEKGNMIQRSFGGQKKKRTAYAKSSTGKAVMTAMIDETRKYEAAGLVHRYDHHEFLALDIRDGVCLGALVRDTWSGETWRFPGGVICCTGGFNGLFPGRTTGTTQNTGHAAAALFAQGVRMANLEFIQYHPTTVQIPGKRLLISEAARGEGGRLFTMKDGKKWYFMEDKYPEMGNLMPRDVISREMAGLPGQVWLDLTGLSKGTWRDRLPDLRREIQHYLGLDPAREPVPVSPGIHFFMGGIWVDRNHRTSVKHLYAAGECACQYHGANRLGGNSLLGAIYGGRVAAATAMREAPAGGPVEEAAPRTAEPETEIGEILFGALGVLREGRTMEQALETLQAMPATNRVLLGRAMLCSALARQESRGAHTRLDYPDRDDARFQKTTIAVCRNEEVEVSFQDLPQSGGPTDAN